MTHAEMVQRAVRWLRGTKRCKVVLAERGVFGEFPDAIGWDSDGHSWVVECKVSRGDFLRDDRKDCRGVLAMGEFRYYMALPGIVKPDEHLFGWGLVEVGDRRTRTVRAVTEYLHYPRKWDATSAASIELRLLISELRRYQIYGITYPPLVRTPRRQ
jgi:hypothetical protein